MGYMEKTMPSYIIDVNVSGCWDPQGSWHQFLWLLRDNFMLLWQPEIVELGTDRKCGEGTRTCFP